MENYIFDLDMTLVDSSVLEYLRSDGDWDEGKLGVSPAIPVLI